MEFVVEDGTYVYEVYGEGPPVVLLHGFTGSSSTWSSFISKYKAHFQLMVIDLPGHGQTNLHTPRDMASCCQDLRQLFIHLEVSPVHLVGYSMGGRTALSFALTYPEMVRSLTLESSSPGLATEMERMERVKNDEKLAKKIEQEGVEAFVNYWETIPLFETQRSLPNRVQAAIRKERLGHTAAGLANSLRYMGTGKQPSWWQALSRFEQPVQLMVGQLDRKFININQQMDELFPKSLLQIVPQAGHAIHVEQPEMFGKLVSEFISQSVVS